MISYVENGKKFNFRVGGIILNNDGKKILLHRLSSYNFWVLPGGRVEMLEGTEDTIKRELKEELGIDTEIDRLVVINESFFKLDNITFHELGFNYLLKISENFKLLDIKTEFPGIESDKYRYKWFDRNILEQLPIKPNYFIPILQNLPDNIMHIIKDERIN